MENWNYAHSASRGVIARRHPYTYQMVIGFGGPPVDTTGAVLPGKTRDVAAALRGLEAVESVDVVTGPYDIIALINGADMMVVGNVVTENIHTVPGVVRTVTCVAVGP